MKRSLIFDFFWVLTQFCVLFALVLGLLVSLFLHYKTGMLISMGGFLGLALVGIIYKSIGKRLLARRAAVPAQVFPKLLVLHNPLENLQTVLGASFLICFVTLFASARWAGNCDLQDDAVFAAREGYFLSYRGDKTEVTRLRFLTVGASGILAWHSLMLVFAIKGLHILIFGENGLPQRPRQAGTNNLT